MSGRNTALPPYRMKVLFSIWKEITELPELPQLDRFLSGYFKQHKKIGKRDRTWYRDQLFDAMRYGELVVFVFSKFSGNVRFASQADSAPGTELFDSARTWQFLRKIPAENFFSLLEEVMRTLVPLWRKSSVPEFSALAYTLPLSLLPVLKRRVETSGWDKEEQERFLADLTRRPLLWLRINRSEDFSKVSAELKENGFEIIEEHEDSWAVRGDKGIYELATYKKGAFEIQDFSSVAIGKSADAHPGMNVWDACAGAGGKTVQLASAMQNRGVLYASDIREWKLDDVKARTKRAGYFNVRRFVWEGNEPPEMTKELEKKKGFHRVLVDAPCSSSGTWRRNPDARYRLSRENLSELTELQLQLLTSAAPSVRPDGRIIYATCSWFVEENEDVVEKFLESEAGKGFELKEMQLFGSPRENADVMFSAVFEKAPL